MAFCRKKSSNAPMMFLACHHRVSLLVHIVPIASHGKHSLAVTNRYLSFGEECKPASCQSKLVKILYRNNIDLDQKSAWCVSVASIFINVTPFIWALPVLGGWVGWEVRAVKAFHMVWGKLFYGRFLNSQRVKTLFRMVCGKKKVPLSAPKCPNDRGAMVKRNLRNAQKAGRLL